ncbi:MAG: NAD(P)-dependent oxidoreductase [Sedimentisphaerales bacterium]|nr:NAD(P)-dependent oxidoreductase [Sedimentisphaerales bacterium]
MADKKGSISKVGITGAAGRIGKNLAAGLAEKYELTLFYRNNKPDTVRKLDMVRADIAKEEETRGIFDGLDAVIHLAASPSTQTPWEDVLKNNIIGTYNVLEEARRAGVRRVVFASTNHVQNGYAVEDGPLSLDPEFTKSGRLIKLTDPPAPDSYYGVSKVFGEDLGRYYVQFHGLEFVSVRIGWAAPETLPDRKLTETAERHLRALFFSQRDCVDLFIRTLEVKADFLVVYGVSNSRNPIFDLNETKDILGYEPRDNEEEYFRR